MQMHVQYWKSDAVHPSSSTLLVHLLASGVISCNQLTYWGLTSLRLRDPLQIVNTFVLWRCCIVSAASFAPLNRRQSDKLGMYTTVCIAFELIGHMFCLTIVALLVQFFYICG
ncbi:unnamed protein product, partial [Dicrocoelium dendriticum]